MRHLFINIKVSTPSDIQFKIHVPTLKEWNLFWNAPHIQQIEWITYMAKQHLRVQDLEILSFDPYKEDYAVIGDYLDLSAGESIKNHSQGKGL